MKKLKLNKKMVNALIGFTGFTLISSFSSCKCSGVTPLEPGITSEVASEDESIIISDNSELTSEVTSENVTSETNDELTSESNTEELGNGNESGNGTSEVGSGSGNGSTGSNDDTNEYGETAQISYSDEFLALSESEQKKLLEEMDKSYNITWDEILAMSDTEYEKFHHKKYSTYLKIYGTKYLNDLIRDNLAFFVPEKYAFYRYNDHVSVYLCDTNVIIRDYDNNLEIQSYYTEEKDNYGDIKQVFIDEKKGFEIGGYYIGDYAKFQIIDNELVETYKMQESSANDLTDKYGKQKVKKHN